MTLEDNCHISPVLIQFSSVTVNVSKLISNESNSTQL